MTWPFHSEDLPTEAKTSIAPRVWSKDVTSNDAEQPTICLRESFTLTLQSPMLLNLRKQDDGQFAARYLEVDELRAMASCPWGTCFAIATETCTIYIVVSLIMRVCLCCVRIKMKASGNKTDKERERERERERE